MFKIEVSGNLGGDAQVKEEGGRKYVQFSVADTRKFTKEDGTAQEITNWVSCFMRNADSPVIPYLKKGVRVWVRGNGDLRLFSSAKDRMMKAGASVNVSEIELMGGSSDDVPRELALPTGQIMPVQKLYWINLGGMQVQEVYDKRGRQYQLDPNGFVIVTQPQQEQPQQEQPQQELSQQELSQQEQPQQEQQQQEQQQQEQPWQEQQQQQDQPFTGEDTPEQIKLSKNGKKK